MAAVVVVVYDLMASITSRMMGVDYAYFGVGSLLIYLIAPFILTLRHSFWIGAVSGFLIGFTDSTAGLAIALLIGPPEFKNSMQLDTVPVIFIILSVTLAAGLIGLLASGFALLLRRKRSQA